MSIEAAQNSRIKHTEGSKGNNRRRQCRAEWRWAKPNGGPGEEVFLCVRPWIMRSARERFCRCYWCSETFTVKCPPPLLWSRDEHSFAPYDVRTTVLPGGTCLRIVAALSAFQASSSVPLNSLLGLTPFSGLSEFLSRNSDFFWQGILYASGYANKNVLNTTSSSLPFVKKNIEAGDGIKPVVVNSLNDIFRIFSVNMVNPSNQITLYRNQLVVRIKID